MGSVNSNPACDLVLFFDHGMHLTVEIWKRCSKQTDKFFERRSATDRRTGARPKELDVVRQNLVRDFESSLAHYLVGIELNERLALLLNTNPPSRGGYIWLPTAVPCLIDLQRCDRAGEKLTSGWFHFLGGTVLTPRRQLVLR